MDLADIRRERNTELRAALLWSWVRARAKSFPVFNDEGEIVGFSYVWLDQVEPSDEDIAEATQLALAGAVADLLGLDTIPEVLEHQVADITADEPF